MFSIWTCLRAQIGQSKKTEYRRRKAAEVLAVQAAKMRPLTSMGFTIQRGTRNPEPSTTGTDDADRQEQENLKEDEELKLLQIFLPGLKQLVKDLKKKDGELASKTPYEANRFLTVALYADLRVEKNMTIMEATRLVGSTIWHKVTDHQYKVIRKWTKEYLDTGDLAPHRHGTHSKTASILSDEDIKEAACQWIREQAPEGRIPKNLKTHLETVVIPAVRGLSSVTVSERTIVRYLHKWGYQFRESGKDVRISIVRVPICSYTDCECLADQY